MWFDLPYWMYINGICNTSKNMERKFLIGSLHRVLYHGQCTSCLMQIKFKFQWVTLPKGMPVRNVHLMGVNVNSLIWGMSPHYYHVAPSVMQWLAVAVEANQDNTSTPNRRIQEHEDASKTPMTVKHNSSNQIIKWFELISVCRLKKSHGIQYNYKHCKTWYGYLSNMTQPNPPTKTIQFVKIKMKSFNKSIIGIWTFNRKITCFSYEDHILPSQWRNIAHSLVDLFYCALVCFIDLLTVHRPSNGLM